MTLKSADKIPFFPILTTLALCAGQIFRYPNSVRDIADGSFPDFLKLDYPLMYTVFAPFFEIADRWSFLSLRQHEVMLIWLCAGWVLFRICRNRNAQWNIFHALKEFGYFAGYLAAVACAAALVTLVPRPMAALKSLDPDIMLCDFHSHTSYSWDARKSFTPERNLDWHSRAGFDAAFITDHNVFDGSEQSASRTQALSGGIVSMRGEEVSLHRSHWAVLGVEKVISNSLYDSGLDGVRIFLSEMNKPPKPVVVASLPEYWLNHWGEGVSNLAAWGADGFEIVNSAPIALDFPPSLRRQMVEFCRERNLIVTGITDSHGWGSSCYVWNAVRLPGWRQIPRAKLESALLHQLRAKKFEAVKVIVRVQAVSPENIFALALDPLRQAWEGARSMPLTHATVSLLWIWIPWGIYRKIRS